MKHERFEYTLGGLMVGAEEALRILGEHKPDFDKDDLYERAINRFRYLANRVEPVEPKFHKGVYGHKYDSYTCGACGHTAERWYRFCAGCGVELKWRTP